MALTLRPVEKDDESFLFRLYSVVRMNEVAEWGWSEAQQEAFLRMQFNGQQAGYRKAYPGASHSIILSEGEPIGRLFVGKRDGALRLVDISILPEHRGAGSGTSLIRDLQDEAGRERLPLRLQVMKTNPALRLYERMGFRVIEDAGAYFQMEYEGGEAEERNVNGGLESMAELLKMDDFAKHLNTRFTMHLGETDALELELVSTRQLSLSDEQDEYSLLFLGPDKSPVAQGTYRLTHDEMGTLDIFLVPIRKDVKGVTYEAIYNLLPREFESSRS
jgi:ribosomal protein S18 acetylase RimI-like enzyme